MGKMSTDFLSRTVDDNASALDADSAPVFAVGDAIDPSPLMTKQETKQPA